MGISGTTAGEAALLDDIQIDEPWRLVQAFSTLVRESGTDDESRAVSLITSKLDEWDVPHVIHRPELLISLPREASLTVGDRRFQAKTPSMAPSVPDGETAPLVYQKTGFARSISELFVGHAVTNDVTGKIVLTEGFALPQKVADFERSGAAGAVFISPGERIHEMICTPVWGSPDLTTFGRQPGIPVISVSKSDGEALIALLEQGESPASTIVANHDERWREIPVVVAEIRGQVQPDEFVLVHGHLDSWHVGIGDNATGDATLLELARVFGRNRKSLARSVRIAWWSGHSHGRYAGSTWFADAFATDLLRNCVCHINCDSPGCRDATAFEDIAWMAETETFARDVIRDVAGLEATGAEPARAGDISFNNLGISTLFMLSSTIPADIRAERELYGVGGCGGNIEWHTEADLMDVADADILLRDIKLYAATAFRAASLPVHPLDLRATVEQIARLVEDYGNQLGALADVAPVIALAAQTRDALAKMMSDSAALETAAAARATNDAIRRVGRELVPLLYAREGRFRQDPALEVRLLPDLAAAAGALESHPAGVVRTEAKRGLNRIEAALLNSLDHIAAVS
jgi:N-acetylated-alpha-linked acidic dipeptidase